MTLDEELNAIQMAAQPGERATVMALALVMRELRVIREVQEHHADLFSTVTCGGTRMATEAM